MKDVTEDKPQFEHDCDGCHYLGNITVNNPDDVLKQRCVDLYFCETLPRWTVIARYGDKGYQYMSGAGFSYGASTPLTRAAQLAIDKGLLSNLEYKQGRYNETLRNNQRPTG